MTEVQKPTNSPLAGGTIAFSWGRYGGFYIHRYRVCLGWVALTYLPLDLDDVLHEAYPEIVSGV